MMTTKPTKTRLKTAATLAFVPQNANDTVEAIREIGEKEREITRLQADMNDELARVKERWEAEVLPLARRVTELTTGVQIWCEANRAALTQNGKVKTAAFASGEVAWRTRPPSVHITGVSAVLDALVRLGLSRFIREKREVNREAILNEPQAVAHVPGISIRQGEDFVIQPFEAELTGGTS
jgi:phage host-nuclease inhibitor protein Gam